MGLQVLLLAAQHPGRMEQRLAWRAAAQTTAGCRCCQRQLHRVTHMLMHWLAAHECVGAQHRCWLGLLLERPLRHLQNLSEHSRLVIRRCPKTSCCTHDHAAAGRCPQLHARRLCGVAHSGKSLLPRNSYYVAQYANRSAGHRRCKSVPPNCTNFSASSQIFVLSSLSQPNPVGGGSVVCVSGVLPCPFIIFLLLRLLASPSEEYLAVGSPASVLSCMSPRYAAVCVDRSRLHQAASLKDLPLSSVSLGQGSADWQSLSSEWRSPPRFACCSTAQVVLGCRLLLR